MMRLNNNYFFARHGESIKNIKKIASCWPEDKKYPLTKKGKKQIERLAEKIKKKKIDLIFTSDILRAKQTATIIGEKIGLKPNLDKRLREVDAGIFNGKPLKEIGEFLNQGNKFSPSEHYARRFKIAPPGGENYKKIEKRALSFLKETEKKYKNKNILIISHGRPITIFEKIIYDYDIKKFVKVILEKKEIRVGELRKVFC